MRWFFAVFFAVYGIASAASPAKVEPETHASIYPAVLSTGIRHLFQTMDE